MLEKTLESPLDCQEIKPVNLKGNQSWIFIGRTDGEAEAPTVWPPDAKNWHWNTGKDPDTKKDWGQEEKGVIEDEMVGWHHWLSGHEFEQTPGASKGQEILVWIHWVTKSWTWLSDWTISTAHVQFLGREPRSPWRPLTALPLRSVPESESHQLAMEGEPRCWKLLSRELCGVKLLFLPWAASIWYFLFYSNLLKKKSWLWPTWHHNTLMFPTGQEYWRTGRESSVFGCVGCCLLSRVLREQDTEALQPSAEVQRNVLCWQPPIQIVQEFHNTEMIQGWKKPSALVFQT